jgi:NADPH2:quinone reductase
MMRAAWYDQTGPADRVLTTGAMPAPDPGPGEALVRVAVSGVNPSDVKKRAGWMKGPAAFPRIVPHSDGAGVIEAVGAGVDPARIGERVWLWNAQWGRPFGTAAELVALPAEQAVSLPAGVAFAEGACLGIPARTGWVAAMEGRPAPGRRILVQGGGGAVGAAAVATAAAAVAEVIAIVSDDAREAVARRAGAAHALRRDAPDLAGALAELTGGAGVDHVVEVDLGANWRLDAAVLATNGSIAAYSSTAAPRFQIDYYALAARAARLRMVQVYLLEPEERAAAHAGLRALLEARRLPIAIAARLPLERIAEAHEIQETGRPLGNVVIDVAAIADEAQTGETA